MQIRLSTEERQAEIVAAALRLEGGRVVAPRMVYFGVGNGPVLALRAAATLEGRMLDAASIAQALQLAQVDRLDQVVGRAQAQRLDAGLQVGVAGAEHHLGVGHQLRVGQQVHAVAVGQAQVQQQDVGLLQRDLAARVAQVVGHGHREVLAGDQ